MEPKRIDIEHFDLANEKVAERMHLYIELTEKYFLYTAEYYAERPKADDPDDHTLGWEDTYENFRIKIKRETLVSVDINWLHKRELWRVEVEANGYPNTVKLFFKKRKDAEAVCKALDEYIFT